MVGANHLSGGASLRERLFMEPAEIGLFMDQLRDAGIEQALVLSTCDRVEIGAVHADSDRVISAVLELFCRRSGLPRSEIDSQCVLLQGRDAVHHLFSIAASLESLVIGEPQVLGQVKESHRLSGDAGMSGVELEAVLDAAYHAAKRVRTETGIGERSVSIAAAAERLARNVHGPLENCTVLLIGGGEMGEVIVNHLRARGIGRINVTARITAQSRMLARQLGGHYLTYEELEDGLADADVVVSAIGAGHHILNRDMIARALSARRHKPVFVIDAAVPGDVHPQVNELDSAFVYDIGDLERVAHEGRAGRDAEIEAASAIIEEEVSRFLDDRAQRNAGPLVAALRGHFDAVRDDVLAANPGNAEEATRLLVNRLLHDPSETLRRLAAEDPESLEAAGKLFEELFCVVSDNKQDDEEGDR
jgi:glutamyl-tRNA reductase